MKRNTPCRPYLPPEWAPQSGVMLTWPHAHGDWADVLDTVEPVFTAIARAVATCEKVLIVCFDADHRNHVRARLSQAGVAPDRLVLAVCPSNDTWARDHGPVTVLCRDKPALFDFGFNGWGGKYPATLDNAVTRRLHRDRVFAGVPLETIDFVLEGGSIDVDGSGGLLTTRRCLLAPTRNPGLTPAQIEARLDELLGLNRIMWLDHGFLSGDDTDGHVDTLARFCDVHTIAYIRCDDRADEYYLELKEMERELRRLRAADGSAYRLVALPWPRPKYDRAGRRLPATYANFLIVNGAVLVPTYDDPADELALTRLGACFSGRQIVAINCLPLIHQLGSLHCVTMQLPQGIL